MKDPRAVIKEVIVKYKGTIGNDLSYEYSPEENSILKQYLQLVWRGNSEKIIFRDLDEFHSFLQHGQQLLKLLPTTEQEG